MCPLQTHFKSAGAGVDRMFVPHAAGLGSILSTPHGALSPARSDPWTQSKE